MTLRTTLLTVAVVAAGLSAPALAADHVANAADIVNAADWKKMQVVKIEMGERDDDLFYEPSEIRLKANQPYKLVLTNSGKKKHYFTAEAFYRSIALRKVETRDAEVKAPYITAVEVVNGGTAEIFAVPVKPGTYDVVCTIDDHKDRGMVGKIVVE